MSRRRTDRSAGLRPSGLLAIVLLTTLSLLAAGCTPPGLPPPQSPPTGSAIPTHAGSAQQITVGIDGSIAGFNPYLIADYSAASRTVSSLVLPSVSVVDNQGRTQLNERLVRSAEVTGTDPFTVTYRIDRDASWSDGTPVTAEDFRYLHRQMLTAVGTTGAAAYRAIAEIRSTEAGKTVEVIFGSPVLDWRVMFSPLLPAHILKDAPGGFTGGLADGIPVAAGPYRVESVDRTTGLITLTRNDKYWGTQPGPAQLVLRIGTGEELVAALSRGDVQAIWFRPGSAAAEQLQQTVPSPRRVTVPLPATVQLVFNTASDVVADPAVRRAVAAGLTPDVITDALTGSRPSGLLPVRTMLQLPADQTPSTDGPAVTMGDPESAADELESAGYVTSGLYATRDGAPLRLSLGFPTGNRRLTNTARAIQHQLGGVGIEVDLLVDTPDAIVQRLASGELDSALLTIPRGRSDAVAAASNFRCPPEELGRGGNLSGYCSQQVDPVLSAALSGTGTEDFHEAGSTLWSDLPTLPLGEPVAAYAVGPELSTRLGNAGPGWLWRGPLAGIPHWPAP